MMSESISFSLVRSAVLLWAMDDACVTREEMLYFFQFRVRYLRNFSDWMWLVDLKDRQLAEDRGFGFPKSVRLLKSIIMPLWSDCIPR